MDSNPLCLAQAKTPYPGPGVQKDITPLNHDQIDQHHAQSRVE